MRPNRIIAIAASSFLVIQGIEGIAGEASQADLESRFAQKLCSATELSWEGSTVY